MLAGVYYLSSFYGLVGAGLANLLMFGLFAFNIFTYKKLAGKISWKAVFQDIGWGMILPTTIYMVITMYPDIMAKSICTVALIIFLAIGLYKNISVRRIFKPVLAAFTSTHSISKKPRG